MPDSFHVTAQPVAGADRPLAVAIGFPRRRRGGGTAAALCVKEMKRRYGAILALMFVVVPIEAFSCSCISLAESEEEVVELSLEYSEAVVLAEAISVEVMPTKFDSDGGESQKVRWRVMKSWKGSHAADQIIVSETVVTCCMCGMRVQKGEVFLIFRDQPEPFSLSVCSLSGSVLGRKTQISILDRLAPEHNQKMEPTR